MNLFRWLRNPRHELAPPPHPILGRHALARWSGNLSTPDELMGGHRPLLSDKARVLPLRKLA